MHCLRLSPTGDPLRNLNPKWVSNTIPIASNKISIRMTHFRCLERHNPNLSILSSRNPFVEGLSLLLAPQLLGSFNFDPQLQNRLMRVSQLSKPFTCSTSARVRLFCLTCNGFDHAMLALTMPRWLLSFLPSYAREGGNDDGGA